MFHTIPAAVAAEMRRLENIDATDRIDGTPHAGRLRQIPPETGKVLAMLAAEAPAGDILEIGTSAGYSSLWISLATAAGGRSLTTYEMDQDKVARARETFRAAGVEHRVRVIPGDARHHLADHDRIAFCFLDAEKSMYDECFDLVIPRLVPGGLMVVDNIISHAGQLRPFIDRALADKRVDALELSVGKGILVCRKA